jgi:peptide/nickel transport system substrate-binding protein
VTYNLLKELGMNVEIVETDWGTVTQRRASKEPVEKGGWSIIHTWAPSVQIPNPVQQLFARGLGKSGWFGWFADDRIEQITQDWLLAQTTEGRDSAADAFQLRAFEMVPYVPLGQFQIRTAYRRNLTGLIEATGAYFWNVRRA